MRGEGKSRQPVDVETDLFPFFAHPQFRIQGHAE